MAYCPELRENIMGDVTKYLPLQDYIRFGAIHPSWSAMAKARYHPPDHGFPLLIVNDGNQEGELRLFNISSQSFYPLNLPHGYHCCGSSRGWLLIMNSSMKMCLLNPFSKAEIELPTFLLSESEYEAFVDIGERMNKPTHELLLERFIVRAVLSVDPEKCSDYIIMVISYDLLYLRFWRSGDSSWTVMNIPGYEVFWDVIWYKGAFHALSNCNEVFEVCLSPKLGFKKLARLYGPTTLSRYLVDCMGDLMIIERCVKKTDTRHFYTIRFDVHKLDEKEMEFIEVESIGDHALFIGRNSTIAIPASKFPRCLSDSIYFTDHSPLTIHKYGYEDIGLYNMKNKTVEMFPPKGVYTPKFQPLWFEAYIYVIIN
ncbi:hypothetical protein IHE45_03G024700 [Dioscorea alata]|uniref:Uncharacterized protein n=1 Tax=Dioscorea alata TaxID=55571 RepID=A0ACB7WJQ9_DIOAL|nr:hypothetical protein IHE45_03G024700 [Dioscorea alata]